MTTVVGYIRVSSDLQVDNYSLDAQRHSIETACAAHGHSLLRIYADEGKSAFSDTLAKRPALQEAIAAVLSGSADVLMVDKLDRLARNARVFHDLLYRLRNRVIFLREGIDPTTPTGELVAGILAQSAQFFSRNLGQETRKGKAERVRQGLWLGQVPYGYTKQPGDHRGKLPPIPDDTPILTTLGDHRTWTHADIVRHIFHLAATGSTRRQICTHIRDLGFPMPRGRLNSILDSRFYLGEVKHTADGVEEWLPGLHAPLITSDLHTAARQAARANQQGAATIRQSAQAHALTGLAQCGRCGAPMHTVKQGRTHGNTVRLFCSARQADGSCDQISVDMHRIELRLLDVLRAYAPSPDLARRLAETAAPPAPTPADIAAARRAIHQQHQRLLDLYEWGRITKPDYTTKAAALDARLAALTTPETSPTAPTTRPTPDPTPPVPNPTTPTAHLAARHSMSANPSIESPSHPALTTELAPTAAQITELTAMLHDLPTTYLAADEPLRNELIARLFTKLLIDSQELIAVRPKPTLIRLLQARLQDPSTQLSWRCRAGRRRWRW